jgi:hypothetical protein
VPRRSLVFTAAVFLVLLAVTVWLRRTPERPEDRPFFTLKALTPDTLTVVFGPDTTVVVPGGKTGWRVVSPVDYPADGLLVETVLKRLEDLEVKTVYPMTDQKLDSYGMRVPRGMLRAAYADGRAPDTLFVGGFTPNGAYDYVRPGSAPEVGLLESRISKSYFLKETREIRETRLLPFSETRVRRFELLGAGDAVRAAAETDGTGRWKVTEPYPGPGDAEEIGEYLKALNHMHIRDFVPGGRARWGETGLENPGLGVRVVLDDGSRLGAYTGAPGPFGDVYARGASDPQVFLVPDRYPSVLERSADAFRRAAAVTFGLAQADSVRVTQGTASVVVDLPPPGPAQSPPPVRDVLGNWLLLRADAFAPARPGELRRMRLAPPAGRLVWWGGGDTLAVVDVGAAGEEHLPVRVAGGRQARKEEILLFPSRRAGPLWSFLRGEAEKAGDR